MTMEYTIDTADTPATAARDVAQTLELLLVSIHVHVHVHVDNVINHI